MDTLQHNGSLYVKASVLAKRHRYTTDYIGQLCRQNKVDAQLVGRAWYVNEHSLLNHKIDRKKDTRQNEIISKNATENDESSVRVNVHSVTSKKTFKQFFSPELPAPVNHHWQNRAVAYVDDAATLVPQVTNKIRKSIIEAVSVSPVSTSVPVNLAESETLEVHVSPDSKKHLTFTELPEVALGGVLAIENMDTESDYVDSEPVSSTDFEDKEVPVVQNRPGVTMRYSRSSSVLSPEASASNRVRAELAKKSTVKLPSEAVSVIPAVLPVVSRSVTANTPTDHLRRGPVLLLPVAVFAAIVLATFLVAGSATLRTDGSTTEQSFSFRFSTLEGALIFLSQKQ
jgi:hypothetical protein